MKLREIIQNIRVLSMAADPETEITGISYDSRRTRPGDLFVAVRGFEVRRPPLHPQGDGAGRRGGTVRNAAGGRDALMCRRTTAAWALLWPAGTSSAIPQGR